MSNNVETFWLFAKVFAYAVGAVVTFIRRRVTAVLQGY